MFCSISTRRGRRSGVDHSSSGIPRSLVAFVRLSRWATGWWSSPLQTTHTTVTLSRCGVRPAAARRSLALYYFTDEPTTRRRSTNYRPRPGDGLKGLVIWMDRHALRAYDAAEDPLRTHGSCGEWSVATDVSHGSASASVRLVTTWPRHPAGHRQVALVVREWREIGAQPYCDETGRQQQQPEGRLEQPHRLGKILDQSEDADPRTTTWLPSHRG